MWYGRTTGSKTSNANNNWIVPFHFQELLLPMKDYPKVQQKHFEARETEREIRHLKGKKSGKEFPRRTFFGDNFWFCKQNWMTSFRKRFLEKQFKVFPIYFFDAFMGERVPTNILKYKFLEWKWIREKLLLLLLLLLLLVWIYFSEDDDHYRSQGKCKGAFPPQAKTAMH